MSTAIWKYPLEVTNAQFVQLPWGSRILSVEEQNGALVMYALVNCNEPTGTWTVWILGTGHPADHVPDDAQFVGTVKLRDGALMFHIFAK